MSSALAPTAASPSPWSPEVRVLAHPYRTFAALADAPADARPLWLAARRPLLLLLVIGAFVSFSAAGRLVLAHVGWSFAFWSFIPLIHVAVLAATIALLAPRRRRASAAAPSGEPTPLGFARAVDLYFIARAPWLLLILGLITALTFFIAGRVSIFGFFLGGPLPLIMLAITAWTGLLEYAFFRAALRLSRPRALAATALGYVAYAAPGVVWYLLTEQLQPLLDVATTS